MTLTLGTGPGGFALPDDVATDTIGILAIKGSGKTYAALVLAEELVRANVPTLIVDPVGVAWGLRLSADGTAPGLPVLVLGGEHGDAPLEPLAGRALADALAQTGHNPIRAHVVLDLSGFGTKAEHLRFARELLEELYQVNREPLHVIIDEADDLAPQRPFGEEARVLRAVEVLVRRGRARGLGCTLITQRAACLNKNVLTQCSTLVLGRTSSPQDRAAVEAWVETHSTAGERDAIMASLASLPTADKWVWSPIRGIVERVTIRKRQTFDSSSTPIVGAARVQPAAMERASLASVRDAIVALMASAGVAPKGKPGVAIVSQLATEGTRLASRVRELEGEVERLTRRNLELEATVTTRTEQLSRVLAGAIGAAGMLRKVIGDAPSLGQPPPATSNGSGPPRAPTPRPSTAPAPIGEEHVAGATARPFALPRERMEGSSALEAGAVRLLAVLRPFPTGRSRRQLALLSDFAARGGAFGTHLRMLTAGGYVEVDGAGRAAVVRLTDKGHAAAPETAPLPSGGRALLDHYRAHLPKPQRLILDELESIYPRRLRIAAIASRIGLDARGGAFGGHVRSLRARDLIEGRGELRLSPVFAVEGGAAS